MRSFWFLFAILLGVVASTCGAHSVHAATSASLGIHEPILQATVASPVHNLRQSAGHAESSDHHQDRQLQFMDWDLSSLEFTSGELGAAEIGFIVGLLFFVVVILLLCCCCCGGGGRGYRGRGGCSICDILALFCIWEMCCDQRDISNDFCLV
jgi:hypothetical protein